MHLNKPCLQLKKTFSASFCTFKCPNCIEIFASFVSDLFEIFGQNNKKNTNIIFMFTQTYLYIKNSRLHFEAYYFSALIKKTAALNQVFSRESSWLVSFSLRSTRGGLHHRLVKKKKAMTEWRSRGRAGAGRTRCGGKSCQTPLRSPSPLRSRPSPQSRLLFTSSSSSVSAAAGSESACSPVSAKDASAWHEPTKSARLLDQSFKITNSTTKKSFITIFSNIRL